MHLAESEFSVHCMLFPADDGLLYRRGSCAAAIVVFMALLTLDARGGSLFMESVVGKRGVVVVVVVEVEDVIVVLELVELEVELVRASKSSVVVEGRSSVVVVDGEELGTSATVVVVRLSLCVVTALGVYRAVDGSVLVVVVVV